jgi:hypothetical protein
MARLQMRLRHFSLRTEKVYLGWMRRFIRFHGRRHPRDMGGPEVQEFLLYGSGLRLMEALALRTKDLEFERRELIVRNGNAARTG